MNKKGFTLIELLVVIAIIGILSTWAVWIYTSQLQKARDTTRTTDLNNLRGAIEQFYQDSYVYPTWKEFANWTNISVKSFLQKLPEDPKNGEPCVAWPATTGNTNSQPACAITYMVNPDDNWIWKWAYELSIAFENEWNARTKAATDGWDDNSRYEHFVWVANSNKLTTKLDKWSSKIVFSTEAGDLENELVIITKDWWKKQ